MLIGEQPGDHEDIAGKPFVGPAGKIMDRALEEAGIDRKEVYVTNAVKHKKPNSRETAACRPWLAAELRLVKPNLVVAMGSTAARTIFGPSFRATRERGKVLSSQLAAQGTCHRSSIVAAAATGRKSPPSRIQTFCRGSSGRRDSRDD